jgi:hypothetical protein
MTHLYGPAVRRKRDIVELSVVSCINVSGLSLELRLFLAIMDISAPAIWLADRPRTGAIWVTSVRMRREDRSSISSHPLADLGGWQTLGFRRLASHLKAILIEATRSLDLALTCKWRNLRLREGGKPRADQ